MSHLVRFNNRPFTRQYNDFFGDFFTAPSAWSGASESRSLPATNITETPQSYHVEVSAPGRSKEDFKINVDKDLLTIGFEKKEDTKTEGNNAVRREFSFNSFKRSFSLDEKIDTNNIQAKYENGILKIELPKKEEVKEEVKQIAVN
jgi:HSP20 family protein